MSNGKQFNGSGINAGSLSRRSFLSGAAAIALAGGAAAFLTACGSSQTASSASSSSSAGTSSASSAASSASSAAGAAPVGDKVLVAYFSGTGHTQRVAQELAQDLGADTFVITPAQPYSDDDLNFNVETSRVVREYQNPDQRDTPLAQSAPDNFAEYGTVLVGYPIWWSDASWAMQHFAIDNDFTGRTVIPFCTSYSSPIGQSGRTLANLAGTGDWQEGHRFDQDCDLSEVREWAQTIQA